MCEAGARHFHSALHVDDGRVNGFHQSVVSGTMRGRLYLFDQTLAQKPLESPCGCGLRRALPRLILREK